MCVTILTFTRECQKNPHKLLFSLFFLSTRRCAIKAETPLEKFMCQLSKQLNYIYCRLMAACVIPVSIAVVSEVAR